MAKAKAVSVEQVERGSGVKIQVELSVDTRARLGAEQLRRRVQGLPCTVEAIVLELIERAKHDWPEAAG
jgi:hypothetical protein